MAWPLRRSSAAYPTTTAAGSQAASFQHPMLRCLPQPAYRDQFRLSSADSSASPAPAIPAHKPSQVAFLLVLAHDTAALQAEADTPQQGTSAGRRQHHTKTMAPGQVAGVPPVAL